MVSAPALAFAVWTAARSVHWPFGDPTPVSQVGLLVLESTASPVTLTVIVAALAGQPQPGQAATTNEARGTLTWVRLRVRSGGAAVKGF